MNLNSLPRLRATGVALACMVLSGLFLAEAPAHASLQYTLLETIGPTDASAGSFHNPQGVAFDGTNGSLIVRSESGVDVFGPLDELKWSVKPESSVGVAVNEGTGEIYVDSAILVKGALVPDVKIFGSEGEYLSEINGEGGGNPVPKGFTEPSAVAVDQATGDVYVYSRGNEVIDVFTSSGKYLFQITNAGGSGLGRYVGGLTVDDSTGTLLVGDAFNRGENSLVFVFDAATGAYATTWDGAGTPQKSFSGALMPAVDNATGDVYVSAGGLHENGVEKTPPVIDRFTATGKYENQITGPPGEQFTAESLYGVAVSSSSGDVYVLQSCSSEEFCAHPDPDGVIYVFGASPISVPHVSLTAPSNVKATSMILHGLVDPEETGEASCEFEYGTSTAYGQHAPCASLVSNGDAAVPVEAQIGGLKSDTTYYYRLDAKDLADGYTNIGEGSEDMGQLTTPGPKIVAEGVSAVTAESASFEATVVPNGVATSAYFQYGASEAYGASVPAPPGAALGASAGEVEIDRHIQGLQADVVYHYRLVVLSELEPGKVEEVDGPDRTFTTQPASAGLVLPDGRVWEMVTPAEKHGALFFAQNDAFLVGTAPDPFIGESSVGGNAMIDLASAPTEAEPSGYVKEVSVLSTRGSGGWSSQVITPSHKRATGLGEGGEYEFFSEDLSRGIVDPFGAFTPLSPEATESTPYLRTNSISSGVDESCESSCYRPLVTAADTQSGVKFGQEENFFLEKEEVGGGCSRVCGPSFVDATPDASHVVLSSGVQLTVTPNERQGSLGPFYYEWGDGQLQPLYSLPENEGGGGVYAGALSSARNQLSADGSVFFTYGEHLYLHDFAIDKSVRLDRARGVAEPSTGGARFIYASSDGSTVLFSDSKQLTDAGTGGIYECHIADTDGVPGCELELTKLSIGDFIGASEDASYLYFENAAGSLIVDHRDEAGWTETIGPYIGTLPESQTKIAGLGTRVPVYEVSPDGRWLTFMSEAELTGYDNHDAVNGLSDVEVYLYDAAANRLECASCDPTGARPVGVEFEQHELVAGSLEVGKRVAANLPPWTRTANYESRYQPRFLSDSGRLFFDSNDALVPQDVNGTQDVYEFEPSGVGGCTPASAGFSERSGGCVGLISSGASGEESAFMDASEGGGDVFFITLAKLTSQDFDNALDVYDAHECTVQVPCVAPAAVLPPSCSTGDSCKAAPTPQPSIFGAPSSATFSGVGDLNRSGSPSAKKSAKRKRLSRSQKLARALKVCSRKRGLRRSECVRSAHRRYGEIAGHGKRG